MADLDTQVTAFHPGHSRIRGRSRSRPHARTMKVCEDGRGVVNAAVLVATGVNADGHREVLGTGRRHQRDPAGVEHVLR